jgi:class 3 adenylate cyclase
MSTLLRIGSLLKVGFGEAGAEIIRQSLRRKSSDVGLSFKSRTIQSGVNVSCIFLFCDIRNYTDTTECLREEVFVFTNKIAEVVHSISHSFGGYANKNIGDAFLISWILEEKNKAKSVFARGESALSTTSRQADKALLSVIKIILALNCESFFLSDLSEKTRKSLVQRFSNNTGSIVKMGFGLHTGRAVQGVIGSERKLDATYISNVVEQVEYLESNTKRYGTKLLMSGEFYKLLQNVNQRKCRLIDRVFFLTEEANTFEELEPENFERMEIYTYDMDTNDLVEKNDTHHALLSRDRSPSNSSIDKPSTRATLFLSKSSVRNNAQSTTDSNQLSQTVKGRRLSIWNKSNDDGFSLCFDDNNEENDHTKLTLPSQPVVYKQSLWNSEEMNQIRERYIGSNFFGTFSQGLEAYFAGRWTEAKTHFEITRNRFDDAPSKYFLKKMSETDNVPPREFKGWNVA